MAVHLRIVALWRLLSLLVVPLAAGCPSGASRPTVANPAAGKLNIVCTTGMVADLVRNVAGDRAEVSALFGAVDPHTYEPTARDIDRILRADLVFYSGLLLEGPMQETLERAAQRGKPVYAVTDVLKGEAGYLRYPDGAEAHPDPHVWMDVAAWGRCGAFVAEQLARHDTVSAESFRKNAAAYQSELQQLDEYARRSIGSVPSERRYLVTAHDAFEYFSRAYDIPVRSVQGISTESEAGTDDINQLVDFLVANQVPAVFVESTVNPANLNAVIEGAARKGWKVTVAGELYSDAMGRPGTYEGTYVGMLDHNITRIANALGGSVPPGGLNGQLTH
jgi:manganese/zinc/iron transport system substrate-binding protein